jgi:hypothetical protein
VRRATSKGRWDWDWTLDTLVPQPDEDFDGNGLGGDQNIIIGNAGAILQIGRWGIGLAGASQTHDLAIDGAAGDVVGAVAHLQVARSFAGEAWTFGVGLATGSLEISVAVPPMPSTTLVNVATTSLEGGLLWRPAGGSLRAGASATLPLRSRVEAQGCDPLDCAGYILPERFAVPWSLGVGVAWRLGPDAWNQRVAGDWRDERSLVLAADLWVFGPADPDGGASVGSFVDHRLQRADPGVDLSLRLGLEYEWKPGWVRLRAGSYFEPARYEGVTGRVHGTFGFDVRLLSFGFWGDRYRLRFSLAVDAARRYGNGIASLGFWH